MLVLAAVVSGNPFSWQDVTSARIPDEKDEAEVDAKEDEAHDDEEGHEDEDIGNGSFFFRKLSTALRT